MAYHRVVRDDDYRYPPWATPTGDEDDSPEKASSSLVNKEPQETFTFYISEFPAIISTVPTSASYKSKMSDRPQDGYPGKSERTRPGPQQWTTSDGDDDAYSSTLPTPTTLSTAHSKYDSLTSFVISTTPTRSADSVSSPAPTDVNFHDLQNHGADNGPNNTPIYAAAGIVPVFFIIAGVFAFFHLRKRRRQRQVAHQQGHLEEMKMHPKPVAMPYIAPITPPSPPPAVLPQYSPSTPSSSHPPTASSSQPIILGPIPSGNNGAYLTGMDTSDVVSMTSAGGVSRQGTIVDRDPFADGRSLEEAPPPYRPSSLPPVSIASTSRNSSLRIAAPRNITSTTQLIEDPFGDPEDDEVSEIEGPTLGRNSDTMSDVSELSYQLDPVAGRSPFE